MVVFKVEKRQVERELLKEPRMPDVTIYPRKSSKSSTDQISSQLSDLTNMRL